MKIILTQLTKSSGETGLASIFSATNNNSKYQVYFVFPCLSNLSVRATSFNKQVSKQANKQVNIYFFE